MKTVYDRAFFEKLKKVNVRIRKSVKKRMLLFSKNPNDSQLENHALQDKWQRYRSIDITNDWRALYKEVQIEKDSVAYFVALGTPRRIVRIANTFNLS